MNFARKELQLVTPEQEQKLRKKGFDWRDETPTVALALKWFGKMRKIYYEIKLIQFNHNERDPEFPLEPKMISNIEHFDDKLETFYIGNVYVPYVYIPNIHLKGIKQFDDKPETFYSGHTCIPNTCLKTGNTSCHLTKEGAENALLDLSLVMF